MIGLNPIVVFHVVGGGHNDTLVAFFVAAAVFLFARRELASAICLGLGMSVKASAVVPLILLLVAIAATVEPERRARVLAKYAAVVGGIWLVLAAPYLQRANPTLGLFELSGHDSGKAPGQLLVHFLTWVGTTIGGPAFETPATILAHVLLFGASIVGVWMIARRIWLDPAARGPMAQAAAWGWALLTVILLAPMLGAWYLVWVLPLAWALPRRAPRSRGPLSGLYRDRARHGEPRLPDLIRSVRLPFGHPIALIVCAWIAVDLIRRLMRKTPLDLETAERQFGDAFEAGPAAPQKRAEPREPLEPRLHTGPTSTAPSEAPRPGGSLIPLRFARRR